MELGNKTIIIAGASSGIGKAAAVLFAREGARLVLGARRAQELETITAEIVANGGRATFLAGDVTTENWHSVIEANLTNAFFAA